MWFVSSFFPCLFSTDWTAATEHIQPDRKKLSIYHIYRLAYIAHTIHTQHLLYLHVVDIRMKFPCQMNGKVFDNFWYQYSMCASARARSHRSICNLSRVWISCAERPWMNVRISIRCVVVCLARNEILRMKLLRRIETEM